MVAQCEEDYATLNRLVVDTPEALGRKARLNTWFRAKPQGQTIQLPVSPEEVRLFYRDVWRLVLLLDIGAQPWL